MGANATTSVPKYTAGDVLTAANLSITNSGIPVFADSSARTNAFGGTGEKTLAEGQFAYLEDDNKTYFYDGAAWQEVGGGLVLISSTTIGSAVSSVTVSNAFSSTYDNYLIILSGGVASGTTGVSMTLGATTTGYYRAGFYNTYTSATVTGDVEANAASWGVVGLGTTNTLNASIQLFAPNLAKNTIFHSTSAYSTTTGRIWINGGYLADTTQYTAFTLSASTMTGGTIKVYGLKN